MGNIQILADQIANQIAAGEVVERPASVVKELVENSVDAGSSRIEITIEEGGLHFIRVQDNGSGMFAEDCELAFQRHATSKIRDGGDLFQIRTLGFRGEALPSIAAVAKVDCTTSIDSSGLARNIQIHGGQIIGTTECAAPKGTDLRVRDLFFNTPARLKYMKSIQTELSHISDYVYRMALAHPEIAFTLHHNGQVLLQTLGNGDPLQVIAAIYGAAVAKQMLAISADSIDYQLTGYVAKPECNRSNRQAITTIVNGRFIKNYAVVNALLEAYHTLLPLHRYPLALLHMTMDPLLLDVNVHPAKLEVRFSKEQELMSLIKQTVRDRLLNSNLVPQIVKANVSPKAVEPAPQQQQLPLFDQPANRKGTNTTPVMETSRGSSYPISRLPQTNDQSAFMRVDETPNIDIPIAQLPMMFPVGQVHGTYIVAQNEQGMYLIDQHAAHERLHFELFYERLAKPEQVSQGLLIPLTLNYTAAEAQVISAKLHVLEAVGLQIEPFGGHSFIVRAHPEWFPTGFEHTLIEEMLDWLLSEKQMIDIGKIREKTAIMAACKASITANQSLSIQEMEVLIDRLRKARVPFTCPHGRPIVVSFSTYDLEKLFKRVM